MTVLRVAIVLVFLLVGTSMAMGIATPTPTPTAGSNSDEALSLGAHVSGFMQASVSQTAGTVENGLWVAAYASAVDESERRALVDARIDVLNTSIEDLRAERRVLQAQFRNETISRTTYQARLSILVGQLAALSDGVEDASIRGQAVGVNETRLATLRSSARDLGGGEVSQLARNLSGANDPPGHAGIFDDGQPGAPGTRGGGQGPPTDQERGPPDRNETVSASDPATPTTTSTPTPTSTPIAYEY